MKTSTPLPKYWREGRRLRARELYEQGWLQRKIAKTLGVIEEAVSQWVGRRKAQGQELCAITPRRAPRPS